MADHVSPVAKDAVFARVDQGVDYSQKEPYVSPGAGTVVSIGGFARGEAVASHTAIYIRLDKPILVGNKAYDEVYLAESRPLVKVGQRVRAGQPVMAGGGSEIGFAHNGEPAAPLVGGLGSGTQQSQQGQDFLAFVKGAGHVGAELPSIPKGNPSPTPGPQDTSGVTAANQVATQTTDSGVDAQVGPAFQSPTYLPPGEGDLANYLTGQGSYTPRLWQIVANQPNVSPDTLSYAQNVNIVG